MRQDLSGQEFHELYCPVKNAKSALLLVAYFSLAAFDNWKGLHKPPDRPDLVTLAFLIIVVALLAKSLLYFTCFRERLVLGLVIVCLVTGGVYGFFPAILGPSAHLMELGKLALSLLGLLVSLTMLIQSARAPRVEPTEEQTAIAKQTIHIFLILLAFIGTMLLLGAMLYFLPLR
ncbi:MAG: hypothetical protein WBE13_02110 [Candidatus Acidiferrum sp.]